MLEAASLRRMTLYSTDSAEARSQTRKKSDRKGWLAWRNFAFIFHYEMLLGASVGICFSFLTTEMTVQPVVPGIDPMVDLIRTTRCL